jgi:nitrate/nitrite transport system substrate-binding protein
MRRWGQIADSRPDSWYVQTAQSVYRPDIYLRAAELLVDQGLAERAEFPWDSDGYRAATSEFIDELRYDGRQPNAYIESLQIGLKSGQTVDSGAVRNADVVAAD